MSSVEWPVSSPGAKASTTNFGKNVWSAILSSLGKSSSELESEKNWRKNYIKHVHNVVEAMASSSSDDCVSACRAGLDAMNTSMLCGAQSAKEAIVTNNKADEAVDFDTDKRVNSGAASVAALSFPHPTRPEETLGGASLLEQVKKWASYGAIEQGCVGAIEAAMKNSSPVDGKIFVLLGATSALGPYKNLSQMGATIACISRNGTKLNGLIEDAKKTSCTLLLPTRDGRVGADLLADAPAIARWIGSLDKSKELVICNLAYLDGERHVRASVAMDCISEFVMKSRSNVSLSYLVSPATSHVRSASSAKLSQKNFDEASIWHSIMGVFTGLTANTSEDLSTGLLVVNGQSSVQGPNYALAKTSQQWRAMVAKADGFTVSANHAPAARTENMVSHSQIAAALNGMQAFKPLVAFSPDTASGLMCGLMLNDLNNKRSRANKENNEAFHPMELFVDRAAHGGTWGCAYNTDSIGTSSFLLGKISGVWTPPESVV